MPKVLPGERLLFMPLPVRGLYRCVARYGYTDVVDQVGKTPCRSKAAGEWLARLCGVTTACHSVQTRLAIGRSVVFTSSG